MYTFSSDETPKYLYYIRAKVKPGAHAQLQEAVISARDAQQKTPKAHPLHIYKDFAGLETWFHLFRPFNSFAELDEAVPTREMVEKGLGNDTGSSAMNAILDSVEDASATLLRHVHTHGGANAKGNKGAGRPPQYAYGNAVKIAPNKLIQTGQVVSILSAAFGKAGAGQIMVYKNHTGLETVFYLFRLFDQMKEMDQWPLTTELIEAGGAQLQVGAQDAVEKSTDSILKLVHSYTRSR